MRLLLLVDVEIDEEKLARINKGRAALKQQLHTPVDFCENFIVNALKSDTVPEVKVAELGKGRTLQSIPETCHTED